jgi:hypothetical protein
MKVVRALFDGRDIKFIDPIKTEKKTEVLVIFPNDTEKFASEEARRFLKGSIKGLNLTDKLLKSRAKDLELERRQ